MFIDEELPDYNYYDDCESNRTDTSMDDIFPKAPVLAPRKCSKCKFLSLSGSICACRNSKYYKMTVTDGGVHCVQFVPYKFGRSQSPSKFPPRLIMVI